ncbi:substrate-binding domain-containing protein [Aliagarivorans taiwanensis]|uniref:substrate-binding domain-containing protein n=1 Tax=Aliagarivorans taiwanensis TaxID=561966 RepID=UPI00040ED148|nr:substrate-binding domain-containing protein [Aliagarivorans taiwanensis]
MSTIKDVAKLAGVSVATVSRVVNRSPRTSEKAIKAVTEAMEALSYRPNANARALVSQTTQTMGVLVGDVSNPFFGAMLKSIDLVCRDQGKHLLIGNGYHEADSEREAIEILINSRCESLVIHSKGLSDEDLTKFCKEVPGLVVINRQLDEVPERCISLDNYKGSYLATEYLLNQGHRDIAYICSEHDIEDADSRKQGYRDALAAHGVSPQEHTIAYGYPDEQGGEKAMRDLLSRGVSVTAVAAYNDYMAAGAMACLEESDIAVPEQVSVIGFDDGLISRYMKPRLTTIRYPIQPMAEQAARLALQLAQGSSPESSPHVFVPTLVKRNSVKPLTQ